MSEMFEIYKQKNDLYDELVNHEDYQSNLKNYLLGLFDFDKKTICELGVGTGRVTKIYVDKVLKAHVYDYSEHMLSKAKENLSAYKNKIDFKILNNKDIDTIISKCDYLIEGWSFGHLISDESDYKFWISKLIEYSKKIADNIIIIETLGTFVDKPEPPSNRLKEFYNELKINGFTEKIIKTDYKFENVKQAQYILGSFFGKEMEQKIERAQELIVNEYTGIWTFSAE